MADFDPVRVAEETKWLVSNPEFDEKPASIREFVGEDYLNIEGMVRPGLMDALVGIFGEEVNADRLSMFENAMVTGGIGIGKTTFASIALPYMAHWVLCMKDPQKFFNLLPGSRIAFMQMSTSEQQAREVIFGDLKARIQHSKWFLENYPYDQTFTKQIRFPQKDIWILPGDSQETTFEGYNILAGILDEMDSHKITDNKDYADTGFDTIQNRISSRFAVFGEEGAEIGHKGLIICIGQMKKANGFAARKYKQFMKDPKAYVVRMTIWESLGWDKFMRADGTRASFWYDIKRRKTVPSAVVALIDNNDLIEVPLAYRKNFENHPEKALRDLAGIPPATASPFISMVDRIESARDRWIERFEHPSPVKPNPNRIEFEDWFRGKGDPRKRCFHIDFALSQDALGMAMGHVDHIVETEDGEKKPYIIIDALMRLKANPGQQIIFSEVRKTIYDLKDEMNFRIKTVTMDGFESTDTQQQLRKRKFHVEYLSVDKSDYPYEDLREAIYDERIEWPPYMTYINNGDTDLVEIALQELTQLEYTGKKVDHPPDGSKDVADAMAGVTHTLMGDRSYRRGVLSASGTTDIEKDLLAPTGTSDFRGTVLQFPGTSGLQAPQLTVPGGFGLSVPERLRPRRDRTE